MTIRHTVQSGECFTTLAARYGFEDYAVIYDHPDNSDLKQNRPNPNVLYPGDVVVIPDREPKTLDLGVDAEHRVKLHRPKKELRLALKDGRGEPLASAPYTFQIDGRDPIEGKQTDGDGLVKEEIPFGARSALLVVRDQSIRLRLGFLTPLKETPDEGVRGAQSRLRNLGYNVGAIDGKIGRRTRAAIAMFQHDQGLTIDGELSDELIDALAEEHGS